MKKLLGLLLAVAMVLSLMACTATEGGEGTEVTTDDITINLWHSFVDPNDENAIMTNEFIATYEDEHPNVKIVQHILQDADYKDKLLTEFSGNAQNVDVFTYWGAGRAGDLVDAGKLLCVEDYLSANQVSAIKPGADFNFRYDDKLYGIPLSSWMMVLYCNTELFEENGIALPETYDQWLDACAKLAKAGIIPVALGGGVDDGWQAAFVFEALANRTVGTADEAILLDTMEGFKGNAGYERAAEMMVELNKAGAFGKSPLEIDEVTANVQFLSGVAAMRLTGSWFTDAIYSDEESVIEGKVTALPIPQITGGNGKATDWVGGFIDGCFVNKITKNPDVAVDFAYGLSVVLANHQHEIGEGFTAFDMAVDESGLSDLGREVAALANKMVDGIVAWDTLLPGDLADLHVDACQSLLSEKANIQDFLAVYDEIFD